MTVRRLADNQDINFKFDNQDLKFLNSLLENYPKDKKQSAVVPSLFYAQRKAGGCLLYTSPSPRDLSTSRMPSSA